MGLMNQVPLFGENAYFNLYFPVMVLVVCLLVASDIHKRIFGCFTAQFEFDEDFEHSDISEGKDLIEAEKRRLISRHNDANTDSTVVDELELRPVESSGATTVSDSDLVGRAPPSSTALLPADAAPSGGFWGGIMNRMKTTFSATATTSSNTTTTSTTTTSISTTPASPSKPSNSSSWRSSRV